MSSDIPLSGGSVKNLPAIWENLGLIPGWEDPLEKGIAGYILSTTREKSITKITVPSKDLIQN